LGVQVDAASVLARAAGEAVRVQVRHDPQIGPGVHALERPGDRQAGALVAVDAADDEHPGAPRVAGAHHEDRPAALGAAELERAGDGAARCAGEPGRGHARAGQAERSCEHRPDEGERFH
jgi:hypothetical protein